jgi:PKD repeat protein
MLEKNNYPSIVSGFHLLIKYLYICLLDTYCMTITAITRIKKALRLIVLFLAMLGANNKLNAQCSFFQQGADIDGEENNDQLGGSFAISADGLTMAIRLSYNSGIVRVYKNINSIWTQQGADINEIGSRVSLSADGLTVAIGDFNSPGGGNRRGQVCIFKYISGTWTQQGAPIYGEADNDQSGYSLALSANGLTVAIGANNNAGGGTNRGHVRVYQFGGSSWIQQGADIDGEANNDISGWSVSLSSDGLTVAIGAIHNAGGGTQRGHVRVYKNISGNWIMQGSDIDGEANNDYSGYSVSLSADGLTLAIGAPGNDGRGTSSGHVRVYKNIGGIWIQQGVDIDGEAAGDESGYSVSISANGLTVAIGAYRNAGAGGTLRGHARVYENISSTWIQQGVDIDGEADNDISGRLVFLSADGLRVFIGADYNAGGGYRRGHIRVYAFSCHVPKINVKGNNLQIVKGDLTPRILDSTNMGGTTSSLIRRYKIFNTDTIATLNISSIKSSGAHASDFVITNAPTVINAKDSASFTVTFTPTVIGTRYATITINSNDTSKAAYDFAIQGTKIAPSITLKGNNISIAKGNITPSLADSTNMGSTTSSLTRRYKIFNTGTDTLRISSIVSSGINSSEFVAKNVPSDINANDSASFNITFTPTVSGTRYATITINSNDTSQAAYDFAVQGTSIAVKPLKISLNNDTTICVGQYVSLNTIASGGEDTAYQYTWNNGLSSSATHLVSPSITTIYRVVLTDSYSNPSDTAFITITVKSPLKVNAALSKKTICNGDSSLLTLNFAGGIATQYEWYINGVANYSSSQYVKPALTTNYTIALKDNCSTTDTISVNLTVSPLPIIYFEANDTTQCAPASVKFTNTTTGAVKYLWKFNFNDTSSATSPFYQFNKPGKFDVSLTAISKDGCKAELIKPQFIEIIKKPKSAFSYSPIDADFLNPEITFVNLSKNYTSFEWNFGDQTTDNINPNPLHRYIEDTASYNVLLIAKNNIGCSDSSTVRLHINDIYRIFIPTAISVNNDGLNEELKIEGRGIAQYELDLYNRWGEKVFTTTQETNFKGLTNNGKQLMKGTYLLMLKVKDFKGKKYFIKQTIEIL